MGAVNGKTNMIPEPGARAVLDAGVQWHPASEDAAFRARRDAVLLERRRRERFQRNAAAQRRRRTS